MEPIPDAPVREGSRWRYHRPTSDEVAAWFKTVPLDEGMEHERFVSGVVIIPATEKVRVQTEERGRVGTADRYEMTFTPYVRVDTRIAYFRALAAINEQIAVIEPVEVPKTEDEGYRNLNMPDGFWWHLVKGDGQTVVRYLCCTMRVALYDRDEWFGSKDGPPPRPTREGVATKQVAATTSDVNALARAETGAVGRALGMAGILVVGTGIATAEDMAEHGREQAAPTLPEAVEAPESAEQTAERLNALVLRLQSESPERWQQFSAWWTERANKEGWSSVTDAPLEVRRGLIRRLEATLQQQDSSPAE